MGTYTVGMISAVILSAIVLIYILRKNNLLNINMVAAVSISSIAICLVIPFVFSKFNMSFSFIPSLLVTILIYITVVVVVAVAISLFITDKKAEELWKKAKNSKLIQTAQKIKARIIDIINRKKNGQNVETGLYHSDEKAENILEKSVDTAQIIDKMGIENVNEDILETGASSEKDETALSEDKTVRVDPVAGEEVLSEEFESDLDYYSQRHFAEEQLDMGGFSGSEDTRENSDSADGKEYAEDSDDSAEAAGLGILVSEQEIASANEEVSGEETALTPEPANWSDAGSKPEEAYFDKSDEAYKTEHESDDSINGETRNLPTEQSAGNIDNIDGAEGLKAQRELDVNDYINEAFRLKESGDLEGAILHYMYALDKGPEKDAVFWIVLDTCVLYKEMGQADLAREILEGYVTSFGDMMNVAVKAEIERNLLSN